MPGFLLLPRSYEKLLLFTTTVGLNLRVVIYSIFEEEIICIESKLGCIFVIFKILLFYIKSSILKQNKIWNIDVPLYSEHQFSLYVSFLKCYIPQPYQMWAQPDLNFCHSFCLESVFCSHMTFEGVAQLQCFVLCFAVCWILKNSNCSRSKKAWYYHFVWSGNLFLALLCLPFKYVSGN